jgi:hypothetical protein
LSTLCTALRRGSRAAAISALSDRTRPTLRLSEPTTVTMTGRRGKCIKTEELKKPTMGPPLPRPHFEACSTTVATEGARASSADSGFPLTSERKVRDCLKDNKRQERGLKLERN